MAPTPLPSSRPSAPALHQTQTSPLSTGIASRSLILPLPSISTTTTRQYHRQCAHRVFIDESEPISVGIVPDRGLFLRYLMETWEAEGGTSVGWGGLGAK